jgi:hypothetical protein
VTYWIAFWSALWVGSSRLSHRTVDWLCNASPKPAATPEKPTKEQSEGAPEDSAGEQPKPSRKTTPKPPAKQAAEGSALLRWVGLLITAAAAKGLPWTTAIALGLATGWVLTSLVLGYAAALPAKKPAADPEKGATEEPPAGKPHPAELLTREHVALLLADLYTEGSGVHLATLAEHLTRTPLMGLPATPWATRDVRALLTRHGVRVRDGVRVPPKGGREGVHRDDFPPLPRPPSDPPAVGVVVPGQSNNNNQSNGYPFTVTDDPENPARHTVLHTERT